MRHSRTHSVLVHFHKEEEEEEREKTFAWLGNLKLLWLV
jgi:hypothetical protein